MRALQVGSPSFFRPSPPSLFHSHSAMDTPPSLPPNCVRFPQSSPSSRRLYSRLPRHDTYDNIPSRTNDDIHLVPNHLRRCSDQDRIFISPFSPSKLSLPWFDGRRPSYASIESYNSDLTAVSESMLFKDEVFDATELYEQHFSSPAYADNASFKAPSAGASPISEQQKCHIVEKSFETSEWPKIIIHVILCLIAYPILTLFVVIARNKTLFWSRFFVSVGCGVIGFALGLSLLSLGRPFLEAATWATIIHQSRINGASGIRLSDLAAPSRDPTSAWPALQLLWSRFMYPGTMRRERQHYDKRPWSLAILFFLLNVILAASLPFILGRIVNISTSVSHQHTEYQEVTVKGDLSESDISNTAALARVFNVNSSFKLYFPSLNLILQDFTLTWTLSPFAAHRSLPTAISYPWNNDTAYFSEASLSQFLPGGSGFGTFTENTTTPTWSTDFSSVATDSFNTNAVEPGSLLRYPRWGIRIHCEKVPDGSKNIIPRSFNNYTYLFTPRETMNTLFSSFGHVFSSDLEHNVTDVLQKNDTLPSTVDVNGTALAAYFSDNGVAHSLKSDPVTMGDEGFGWISIEWVLVRLNTTYSPSGTFATYSDESVLDANGTETRIGYDAAVCLELYEPYIVETYNSTTGVPSSTGIISQSKEIMDSSAQGAPEEKRTGNAVTGPNVKRQLNSTELKDVYETLHGNSVNQMIKDNGRDAFYVPSPTLISFTNGTGPYGYTELSGELFAQARARADATNDLPIHLHVNTPTLYLPTPGSTLCFFVPTLPFHVPRRGFDIYSWLAAFRANELIGTDTKSIRKGMETKEMAKLMGDSRISYQW
ncbi:uncharacterized protein EV420DRAFT_1742822 [Desarmillaria tabescens]|uniref:Uncharacterized protein n=1 Tax=Armillaria tabescens TaxID=1929756 RepID=A0AA39NL87_ARMTA|nr:uncharacterized protein EV420DRAFT_1742822 [Desarmillaria tabescens]KAK0467718.1 hypothetical protein EV420DRAFT_1742822 [Desarmillaria tabescens]